MNRQRLKPYWIITLLASLLFSLLLNSLLSLGGPGLSWAQSDLPVQPQPLSNSAASSSSTTGAAAGTNTGPTTVKIPELNISELEQFFPNRYTQLSTAPVRLDGRPIFWVAVPQLDAAQETARETNSPQNPLTAGQRAQEIQARLQTVAESDWQTDTLSVKWELDRASSQPIIYINDQLLMTVTSLDADLSGLPTPATRADTLVSDIEAALLRYRTERTPNFLRQQFTLVGVVALVSTIVHLLLTHLRRLMLKAPQSADTLPTAPSSEMTTVLREKVVSKQQSRLRDLKLGFLNLLKLGNWLGALFLILGLFPYSRWLQPALVGILNKPMQLLGVGLLAYGIIRMGESVIERLFLALEEGANWAPERSQRLSLRFSTFSQVSQSIFATAIVGVTIMVALAVLGVQIAPLLAGAGIVGLAVSLASQSLIKDFINGFLILFEDQFGLGDFIVVGEAQGIVESLNLRVTQLRNAEGALITVPNGQISVVQNLSKDWSRVDLLVTVDPHIDANRAMGILSTVAHTMSLDAYWSTLILEPPNLLGVDDLNHVGVTLRLWIKTRPLKQWEVARELRRRIKAAFDQAGITIGIPQQLLQVNSSDLEMLGGSAPLTDQRAGEEDVDGSATGG
jgi:moderate conductance mechanosensitive channel